MIEHQSVAILGGGESGTFAAILAKKKGKEVFLSDFGAINERYKSELINNNIPFEEKGHDFESISKTDLVITSPGISEKTDVIQFLRGKNKIIVSEIEYASWFYDGVIIAVTGSNGKTTTSSLIEHVLKGLNQKVGIAGNIGKSFSRLLLDGFIGDILVLELSSFQLDNIKFFKANTAILLNITADHLDRYEYEIKNYAKAKFKIFENMDASGLAILNKSDKWTNAFEAKLKCSKVFISEPKTMLYDTRLKGMHNQFNIACVIEAVKNIGFSEVEIKNQIRTFQGVKHRLETIAFINEVEFVNDSKATNVDAVKYALAGIQKRIIWIAGGTDKGNDYKDIIPIAQDKVKALICLGIDNKKLIENFNPVIEDITESQDMLEAVTMAAKKASSGDMVLLSPACASFDLFNNYEHRGEQFTNSVFELLTMN